MVKPDRKLRARRIKIDDLRLLVVDDHALFRRGMMAMLNEMPFVSRCDEAENGLRAIELMEQCNYDIVFLDIDIPKMNGVELAKIISRNHKKTKIIVMTALDIKTYIYQFLDLGVAAYLLKGFTEVETMLALEQVLGGGKYIRDDIRETYHQYLKEKSSKVSVRVRGNELTKTERKIIHMICEQQTSHQIASQLGIRVTTVNTHKRRLFKKLKVVSSVGIAIHAVKIGLYNIDMKAG